METPADPHHIKFPYAKKTDLKAIEIEKNAQKIHHYFINLFIGSLIVETPAAPRHIKFPYVRKTDFKAIETQK